jgi:hypothetical protein
MRTIRTKVYQFSELSKQAQQTAIEWYKGILHNDPDILEGFEDYCHELAKKQGFNDIKVQYSFSYSQGDGLSFSCNDFDIKKFLTENTRLHKDSVINALANNLTVVIKGNSQRYCYASRSDIDLYLDANKDYLNIQILIPSLLANLEDKYLDLCKELENIGYKWLEAAYEDTSIIENIEANEYEFTKDGNRF